MEPIKNDLVYSRLPVNEISLSDLLTEDHLFYNDRSVPRPEGLRDWDLHSPSEDESALHHIVFEPANLHPTSAGSCDPRDEKSKIDDGVF